MSKRLIIFLLILFIIFSIYYAFNSSNNLKKYGKYTIGKVDEINSASNGMRVYISFFYKGQQVKRDYIEDIGYIKKLKKGQRLFIKFDSTGSRTFDFNINCLVPDSLKSAPSEGWSQEWMKEHFHNCIK